CRSSPSASGFCRCRLRCDICSRPGRGRHAGARHRLSRDLRASDPQGRPDTCARCDRSRDADPAIWQRAQSERPLPPPRAGWRLGRGGKWPKLRASRCTRALRRRPRNGTSWEHLARYVARPPVATERLSLTEGGLVRCALKTPYRDGTTHVIFEPEDFIARLAALVPKPRAHLTRYHGVFAPASPDRARVVPKARSAAAKKARECGEPSASDRQRAMTWAQRLKRVFAIDIEICRSCGGKLRVIASNEDSAAVERTLWHRGRDATA